MKDSFGRKINYARISVTNHCNGQCKYCMPTQSRTEEKDISLMSTKDILFLAETLVDMGITKIRLTGGEPLIRQEILDIIKGIGSLTGLEDFAMTTNGTYLSKYAYLLKDMGLHRVNISLDSMKNIRSQYIGGISSMLAKDGIAAALDAGLVVKVNTVLLNGINIDEIQELASMTMEQNIDVRFIELMPIGSCAEWSSNYFISADVVHEHLPELIHIEPVDISSPAQYYKLPNALGKIGLIRAVSNQFCAECNRIRITADGKVKGCLHSDCEIDIREVLSDLGDFADISKRDKLRSKIEEAIQSKPQQHMLHNGQYIDRSMFSIGG